MPARSANARKPATPRATPKAPAKARPSPAAASRIELGVARRIASLRKETDLTLRELGLKTGLSEAYLSRVENGQTAITLANLARVAEAFATPISSFFEDSEAEHPIILRRRGEGKHVWLRGRNGVRVNFLADEKQGKLMEPLVVDVQSAGAAMPMVGHAGQEFVHVLEGECDYHYGSERYHLGTGDSLYFDATVPHGVIRTNPRPCRLISVVSSEDYRFHGNIARLLDDATVRSA
ncbi:helix-turn-helix domain-containing protein [Nibricoccus sp. IMCC34717]|uniref:helix-turn-helix domain-containing protein n=1 Tax=Nibricoccus sp. IMCC34717 TaxID=3034021 RepID=UPI00384A9C22